MSCIIGGDYDNWKTTDPQLERDPDAPEPLDPEDIGDMKYHERVDDEL